jgi:acetylornithine deacetylase/succinyl-diaminopimelate desuccinylase-like protein
MGASDVVELTGALVAIDSVNPSLEPGAAGEREAADLVAGWGRDAGLEVERLEATPGRPSFLVHTRGRGGGRTLLLCGHLDTVGVEGMSAPFEPRLDGDRLRGRGSYDMKAGVAAAFVACREAAARDLAGDVLVAAVADEEHASIGVQEALRSLDGEPDAAIVTEPTEMEIAIAHRGFAWLEIEVAGRAAHGSRPHLGIDAIVKAGPVLTALGGLDERLGERRHPLLGRGSVHASLISGGRDLATYPDRCTIGIERRTLPGEGAPEVERELEDLLEGFREAEPVLKAAGRTLLVREPLETSEGEPIVSVLRDAASGVLGSRPPLSGASFWADSAFIAAAGIPTVLFGPSGEGAHALEEWVSIRDADACAEVLTRVAATFCA